MIVRLGGAELAIAQKAKHLVCNQLFLLVLQIYYDEIIILLERYATHRPKPTRDAEHGSPNVYAISEDLPIGTVCLDNHKRWDDYNAGVSRKPFNVGYEISTRRQIRVFVS